MPRRVADDDDWDEEDWDADDDVGDDDDDEPTMPCPHCKREIHEDAVRCPYCENYLSQEDSPAEGKPWWIVVGVLLCLYAVFRWIVG